MLIRRSPVARLDLEEIWYGIGIHNPDAADRVLDLIESRILQLIDHPLSGAPRYDLGSDIRHLVAGQYLVLYRATDDHILIIRVFHSSRRLPTRL